MVRVANNNRVVFTRIKLAILCPLGMLLLFAGYVNLLGFDLLTQLIFWFVVLPYSTIFVSGRITGQKRNVLPSLIPLTLFYGIMIFMSYKHEDLLYVMLISLVYNNIILGLVAFSNRFTAGRKAD